MKAVVRKKARRPAKANDRQRKWRGSVPYGRQAVLAGVAFLALAGLVVIDLLPPPLDVTAGQVAHQDIVAPRRVVNTVRTEQLRAENADRAVRQAIDSPGNYQINPAAAVQAEDRIRAFFTALAAAEAEGVLAADVPQFVAGRLGPAQDVALPEALIRQAFELTPAERDQATSAAVQAAGGILRQDRIDEANLESVREGVPESLPDGDVLAPEARPVVTAVVQAVLVPNLVLDPQKLDEARSAAMRDVQPVYVEQGQIIVRRGDQVLPEHVQILNDLGLLRQRRNLRIPVGGVVLVAIALALQGTYLRQHHPRLLKHEGLLGLYGLLLIVGAGLVKVATLFAWDGAVYIAPIALCTVLIAILLNSQLALMTGIFLSVLVGVLTGSDVQHVLYALVTAVVGVFSVSRVSQRGDLARAGGIVGFAGVLTMLALGLYRNDGFLITYSFLGLVNGVLSAVFAIGLLPYLESAFGITSSIRLLELSNPNHPLLRKLLMEAPGTYHHSIIVGNLAEAAAEVVGADPLLARVGSQFHDIGKTKRPYFFIENQFGRENPHDKIAPSLSTLILTSHVKDGVELARQHKLPEVIVDFIRQHHGTSLCGYFYHRAMETTKGELEESDFRYPGPKPQSKEAAVVLLADSVEAAVRSLPRPTAGRIESLVRKIVKDRLNDGQLDESDVTLRDLDHVTDVFVRILTGVFHTRVEYPELPRGEMEARRA